MPLDRIIVRGAREHNLQNVTVEIPRDRLVVLTGISGSGKSSLAFDTIYAEGQRKYVESLSAYARQFLGLMEKPTDATPLYVLQSRLSAIQAAVDVTDLAMKTCGGAAFSSHLGIERMFRDARAGWVMAPTVELLRRLGSFEFAFDHIERTPNTLDAHRLVGLAERQGVQDAVVEALFRAYFTEGRDIRAFPWLM